MITVDSLLGRWRAERYLYRASGPEGWEYMVERPHGVRSTRRFWCAWAGRAISYTVPLGEWRTFEQAAAACEEHAVRSQGVTLEVRA